MEDCDLGLGDPNTECAKQFNEFEYLLRSNELTNLESTIYLPMDLSSNVLREEYNYYMDSVIQNNDTILLREFTLDDQVNGIECVESTPFNGIVVQSRVKDFESISEISFIIEPNPISDILNIKSQNIELGQNLYYFDIRNILGQVVLSGDIHTSNQRINTNSLPPGTYLVSIKTNIGVLKTEKIIKN